MDTSFHLTLASQSSLSDFVRSCYLIYPSMRWIQAFRVYKVCRDLQHCSFTILFWLTALLWLCTSSLQIKLREMWDQTNLLWCFPVVSVRLIHAYYCAYTVRSEKFFFSFYWGTKKQRIITDMDFCCNYESSNKRWEITSHVLVLIAADKGI